MTLWPYGKAWVPPSPYQIIPNLPSSKSLTQRMFEAHSRYLKEYWAARFLECMYALWLESEDVAGVDRA